MSKTYGISPPGNAVVAAVYDNAAVYDTALTAAEVNTLFYMARDGVTLSQTPVYPNNEYGP